MVHGVAPLHHAIEGFAAQQGAVVAMLLPTIANLVLGFIIGAVVVVVVNGINRLRQREG